jgi:hypothetical protein
VRALDGANGVVVFSNPQSLVNGFLDSSGPPWRRGARVDADLARAQIQSIREALRDDPEVGPQIVALTRSVRADQPPEEIRAALDTECDELYVRSLVRGHGPTSSAGLLVQRDDVWHVQAPPELLEVLR